MYSLALFGSTKDEEQESKPVKDTSYILVFFDRQRRSWKGFTVLLLMWVLLLMCFMWVFVEYAFHTAIRYRHIHLHMTVIVSAIFLIFRVISTTALADNYQQWFVSIPLSIMSSRFHSAWCLIKPFLILFYGHRFLLQSEASHSDSTISLQLLW